MANKELIDYIDIFREKAELGKLVIFVGSGVSCNIDGMPSWSELVAKMAKEVGYSHCASCEKKQAECEKFCVYRDKYSSDEYLKIPQYVFNKDPEKYRKMIVDSFTAEKADSPLSHEIFEINPAHIITTNFDSLLESSSHPTREQCDVIINDKDLLTAEKSKYIIKMHGDLDSPDTLVFKEEDYLDYSQNHILIELFVKSLLVDHTILFVGYSLNDYNIKLIVSWINYLKQSNDVNSSDRKIGYIVFDQEPEDNTIKEYFRKYSIDTINIHGMPLVPEIPDSIPNILGKRLYSFLHSVSSPSLDAALYGSSVFAGRMIDFLFPHKYIDYVTLLSSLKISPYRLANHELTVYKDEDFSLIEKIMVNKDECSNKLGFLFVNAGIFKIFSPDESQFIDLDREQNNELFDNRLFDLYLEDNYTELASLITTADIPAMEKMFFRGIIEGYNELAADYSSIDYNTLSTDEKVAFLHNNALLEYASFPIQFDKFRVINYISNLAQQREKNLYDHYEKLYTGNIEGKDKQKELLEKLKKNITKTTTFFFGCSIEPIAEMRNNAIKEYLFYFSNALFFNISSDAADFFLPYIEAVICANCELAARKSGVGGILSNNKKYQPDYVDFDIITKFIGTKKLSLIMHEHDLKEFDVNDEDTTHLVECFENLCDSIQSLHKTGYNHGTLVCLCNLALVLEKIPISDENAKRLAAAIDKILADSFFIESFFSTNMPDYSCSLDAISDICAKIPIKPCIETFKKIVGCPKFFDYVYNISLPKLRKLTNCILAYDRTDFIESELCSMVESETDMKKRICLLRLVFKYISSKEKKESFSGYIIANFTNIGSQAIYDFVFSGWVSPSEENIEELIQKIAAKEKEQKPGIVKIPDPVQMMLECIYILYLKGIIKDLSPLKVLSGNYPHLQFLLNPTDFDYTQVDFSDYMWMNFARQGNLMKHFVNHSSEIRPKLIQSLQNGEAGDDQRKILYRFMTNDTEIWTL